jgi:hypothetical protein
MLTAAECRETDEGPIVEISQRGVASEESARHCPGAHAFRSVWLSLGEVARGMAS